MSEKDAQGLSLSLICIESQFLQKYNEKAQSNPEKDFSGQHRLWVVE